LDVGAYVFFPSLPTPPDLKDESPVNLPVRGIRDFPMREQAVRETALQRETGSTGSWW